MTKRCGKCGEEKPLEQFHLSRRDGRQLWCKACRKLYDAEYHRRTLDRRRAAWPEKKRLFREWYCALKEGKPCADCGGSFPPDAMHWDHLPGMDKRGDVGNIARNLNRNAVLAEIKKCELVCANCHAVRTMVRRERGVAQPG